ncbi:MAG: hypothetical protein H6994_12165 [Pseudomonadales bacterium]|nr:hypothetical protein [Pseudomonadales bacterium]
MAAGIVPAAHGNDGGGSIRIPASLNGLVGLKSSRGRVSNGPFLGEAWSGLAHEGALTRSVRDAAALLDAIAGYEPGDPYGAPSFQRPLRAEVGQSPGALRVGFVHTLDGYETHSGAPPPSSAPRSCSPGWGTTWKTSRRKRYSVPLKCSPLLYRIFAPAVALDVEIVSSMAGWPVSVDEFEPRTQDHARRSRNDDGRRSLQDPAVDLRVFPRPGGLVE